MYLPGTRNSITMSLEYQPTTNPYPLPSTIDEVLQALDAIIDEAILNNSYTGLFAYLYRRVTAQIRKKVEEGFFDDNQRMQRFDIVFANLYLDAYYKYCRSQPTSRCWEFAFQLQSQRLTYTQHLLMGMNAHINLDLAIAASTVMQDQPIERMKNDFHKVNEVLFGLTKEMQLRLGRVSPLLFLLDWVGEKSDERLVNFSIKVARAKSWQMAKILWGMDEEQRRECIGELDETVRLFSQRIKSPKLRTSNFVLRLIGIFERKEIGRVLEQLRE